MEKFQIAKYGMMQVTAVVYGVLASGAMVKFNRSWPDQGYAMPDSYYRAIFYRDYGFYFLFVVMAWTAGVTYLSSQFSTKNFDERTLVHSGMALTLLLAVAVTIFAAGGAAEPHHSTLILPLR
jgi:hypothetical protein